MAELPMPSDHVAGRWYEQRRRRALLEGDWLDLLYSRARLLVGNLRREAWGFLDMSANPLRQLADQFATLYDHEPAVRHPEQGDGVLEVMDQALGDSGYWAFMQRVQRDAVALRDMFVRFDIDDDGELVYDQVWPDYVRDVRYDPSGRRLKRFPFLRLRPDPKTQRKRWFWDVLEVVDGVGTWRVVEDVGGSIGERDYSRAFLRDAAGNAAPRGGLTGDLYPYRRGDGTAFIPVARYRAQLLGARHWDCKTWVEVVEGTLNVAVYWSFWGHVLRAASWPQRYVIGAHVKGVGVQGAGHGARTEITTDPAVLLKLTKDDDYEGQPIAGQFGTAGDPAAMAASISVYEARIAAGVGVSPSDLTRTSGDPRSGYALAVSREAQREQQRKLKPAFRQGDRVALEVIAALLNLATGLELPERGWRLDYVALPLSAEERRVLREETLELLDRGFLDEVEAMRRLSGHTLSRADARRELERIRAQAETEDQPPAESPPTDPGV